MLPGVSWGRALLAAIASGLLGCAACAIATGALGP